MKTQFSMSMVVVIMVLLLAVKTLAQQPELVVQTGHVNDVLSVAFSPDGKTLASGSQDNTIKLWEVATGRELRTLSGHFGSVFSVAFSADGQTLASASADHTIRLWDVATGGELRKLTGHSASVNSLAFSPDGTTLASGSDDKTIRLWEVPSGRELRTITGHSDVVNSIAFRPDGKIIASGGGSPMDSKDNTIKLWEVATGRELRTILGHTNGVNSVAFSPDGKTLASGSFETIKLWQVATGRALRTITGHTNGVNSVAFSPDGKTLASGSSDMTIKLWQVATGRQLRILTGHSDHVNSVVFSPDGKMLASGSYDHTIKFWDLTTGRELHAPTRPSDWLLSVAFSSDGKTLAGGSFNHTINLWEADTGRESQTIVGHSESVDSVVFSPDGKTLASGGGDFKVKLWEIATRRELRTLTVDYPDYVNMLTSNSVVFSPDGKTLVSGGAGYGQHRVKLWEVATGRELRTVSEGSGEIKSLAFSPDGKLLASGGGSHFLNSGKPDKTVRLWEVTTGRELRTLSVADDDVNSVGFSPDGKVLAAGSDDKTIKLWEVATGRELRTLTGHLGAVRSVAFSADGQTLASASQDNTIKLWEVATGRELRTLTGHSYDVLSVAFSPDGRFLASASLDSTTKLWRVDSGELLASLISFDKEGWAVVTPDGRFDTNSLEEIPKLHWVFPDNPFKTLPPEIFMRQYYEPRLLPRLLQNKSFDPVPPLASLNRVQPEVKIRSVVPAANSKGYVNMTVEVANASGEQMRDGTRVTLSSGVYDLRLFRDWQLVGYVPGKIALDTAGKATLERAVKLPQRGDLSEVEFTAYAFNSDQVKSATASYTFKPTQALPAVKGRAYIISVGVNAYEDPAWRLSFAARDAQVSEEMLSKRLAATGEYEVVPITLTSDYHSGAEHLVTERLATKQNFHTVLELLAAGPEKVAAEVVKQIPGAERLRKAELEDLVLISFSSHGYTDKHGKFYLVAYDTGGEIKFSADGQEIAAESLARFISSDELSEWVRDIDAGELVMIVDTCHSASAVEQPGFKPGPMGSRGMGQLAYDKGMRILAASQADDVALELDRLQHGLLTYALMAEGLEQKKADKNGDGHITLDEWLGYGAERVPTLYEDVKAGKLEELKSRDVRITSTVSGASVKKNAFQQPQLFDFKRKRREVVLQ